MLDNFFLKDDIDVLEKLNVDGLYSRQFYFLLPYLNNRKQRTKINHSLSNVYDILTGVASGKVKYELRVTISNSRVQD